VKIDYSMKWLFSQMGAICPVHIPIINSSSKLSLAEERRPLTQHFFLVPGVDVER
jgi:hypothetical protein